MRTPDTSWRTLVRGIAAAFVIAACNDVNGPDSASEADRSFIDGMVPHHGMAVMSADMALDRSNRQQLRDMAAMMREDQQEEIALLTSWKQSWFGTDSVPSAMMPREIPPGPNFDLEWMRMMNTHHQGAIDMATLTLRADARAESDSLARAIIQKQREEQQQLRAWAQQWYGVALLVAEPR